MIMGKEVTHANGQLIAIVDHYRHHFLRLAIQNM